MGAWLLEGWNKPGIPFRTGVNVSPPHLHSVRIALGCMRNVKLLKAALLIAVLVILGLAGGLFSAIRTDRMDARPTPGPGDIQDTLSWRIEFLEKELASVRSERDGLLDDIQRIDPELAERYRAQQQKAEEARRSAAEAERQQQQAERSRELAEHEKLRAQVSEGRTMAALDSLARAKRETDRLSTQLSASVLAQNSMAIKGDPALRGLMAVHAQQVHELSGGDVNSEEVVRALSGALEVLELGQKPGVPMDRAVDLLRTDADGSIIALSTDGRGFRVQPGNWRKQPLVDLSGSMDKLSGKAFLVGTGSLVVLADDAGIRLHAINDGSRTGGVKRTPHRDQVRTAAYLPGTGILATGDLKGTLVVWRVEGNVLKPIHEHTADGPFRSLVEVPARAAIVGVDGSSSLIVIGPEGQHRTVRLPNGEKAWSICTAGDGKVLVGTTGGGVWEYDPAGKGPVRLETGSTQRIERIAHEPASGVYAWVDAAKRLEVQAPAKAAGTSAFRRDLDMIPGAMAIGSEDILYLSSADGIRPVHFSSRAMAQRICELVGRTWTAQEWDRHIGHGEPAATCTGF
jgi:hypothetical protein